MVVFSFGLHGVYRLCVFFSFVRFRGFVASLGLMRVLLGSGLVGLGFRVLGLG